MRDYGYRLTETYQLDNGKEKKITDRIKRINL